MRQSESCSLKCEGCGHNLHPEERACPLCGMPRCISCSEVAIGK